MERDEGHSPPAPALIGHAVAENVLTPVQKGPDAPSQRPGALPVDDFQPEDTGGAAFPNVRVQ